MSLPGRCPECGCLRASARVDPHAAGFEDGYSRGYEAGFRDARQVPAGWAGLEARVLRLVHPDAHDGTARVDLAVEVTRELIELREARRGR